jgi:hypothetical protein
MTAVETEPGTAVGRTAAGRSRQWWLAVWLRTVGLVDLLAIGAVLAPNASLAAMHQQLRMGSFPDAPVAWYLARSTSWLYVVFAALLLFLSGDVVRHRPTIRFLAGCGFVSGLVLLAIDWSAGMPLWWTATEGPCCLLLAGVTWGLTTGWTDAGRWND